jgi:hypothetical protein
LPAWCDCCEKVHFFLPLGALFRSAMSLFTARVAKSLLSVSVGRKGPKKKKKKKKSKKKSLFLVCSRLQQKSTIVFSAKPTKSRLKAKKGATNAKSDAKSKALSHGCHGNGQRQSAPTPSNQYERQP